MKKSVLFIVSLLLIFMFSSCKTNVVEEGNELTEVSTITESTEFEELPFIEATVLYDHFKQNSQYALLQYKDKRFNITGFIELVGEDEIGRPYVVLGKAGGDGFNAVSCIFTKKQQAELSQLNAGDSVTIKGTVHDYLMNVIVYDSQIVSTK